MPLSAAASIAAFARAPIGRYVLGPRHCFYQIDAHTNGLVVWGSPEADDVRAMMRAFDVTLSPPVGRHVSLVDVRALCGVDGAGFELLLSYMRERREAFAPLVERQALLCSDGAFGAAMIGLYHLMNPAYPTAVFNTREQALAWLSPKHPERVAMELDLLHACIFGTATFVLCVRAALDEQGIGASLETVARRLGVSVRSLQRRLQEHGTSFRAELARRRIERACELLRGSTAAVGDIAERVGFSSTSAFVAAFHRARGETPAAYRRGARLAQPRA